MLPRSQYLFYLRKVPIEESDLNLIKSLSSSHVPTAQEIKKLRKHLRLPMDTNMILWFWKSFKQEHLLIDQLFEGLDLRRHVVSSLESSIVNFLTILRSMSWMMWRRKATVIF